MVCHQCGGEFEINSGVSTHVDYDTDGPDFDADADHVPFSLED